MTLPVAVVDGIAHPPRVTLAALLCVAALGVFGTGLAYVLYYRLIADVGATTASLVTYLIPLFGVALGVITLDEKLSWNVFAGAALVICGISLAGIAHRPQRFPAVAARQ